MECQVNKIIMSTKEEREEAILHLNYNEQTIHWEKRDRNRKSIELSTPNPYSDCPMDNIKGEDDLPSNFMLN